MRAQTDRRTGVILDSARTIGFRRVITRDEQVRRIVLYVNQALVAQLPFMLEYYVPLPEELAAHFVDRLVLDIVINAYQSKGWTTAVFYRGRSAFYLQREMRSIPLCLPSA